MSSKYAALFTSVNLLLGVGPLILPMPFFEAGIVLSIVWMVIVCLLSYKSAMFSRVDGDIGHDEFLEQVVGWIVGFISDRPRTRPSFISTPSSTKKKY